MSANICNLGYKCRQSISSSASFSCTEQLARQLMSTERGGELSKKQARGLLLKKGKAFASSVNKPCARDSFPLSSFSAKHYMAFTENGFCRWQHALERFQRVAPAKRVGLCWRLGTLVVFFTASASVVASSCCCCAHSAAPHSPLFRLRIIDQYKSKIKHSTSEGQFWLGTRQGRGMQV